MIFFKKKKKNKTKRAYNSAASGRLYADWAIPTRSENAELEMSLKILRNRARNLYQNNDYIRRFVRLLETNVVGHTGFQLKNKALDDNWNVDTLANLKIEQGWKQWGTPEFCSKNGVDSWIDVLKQILHSTAIDGEILVRLVPDSRSPFGFSLYPMEADYLDETLNKRLQNGNEIKMGVEVDSYNRPIAYWLLNYHPGDLRAGASRGYTRVPAADMLHIFLRERPGQVRGVSWIAASAARMKMLNGFEEATLVASRVGAASMGWITGKGTEEWTGDTLSEDNDDETTAHDEQLYFEAEPGVIRELPEGKDFKEWNPNQPNANFSDFVKAILRGVASGLNVSYVTLANDLEGVSYSSIRQGEMADRDHYKMLQVWMIEHVCDLIFPRWLEMALFTQKIKLPFAKFEKFNQASWRPRGWMWIDPLKESTAAAKDIANGIESIENVSARRGTDIYENIAENAAVKKVSELAGLTIPALNPKEAQNGNQNNTGTN